MGPVCIAGCEETCTQNWPQPRLHHLPCSHAGNSRVQYLQRHYLFLHAWKRGEHQGLG